MMAHPQTGYASRQRVADLNATTSGRARGLPVLGDATSDRAQVSAPNWAEARESHSGAGRRLQPQSTRRFRPAMYPVWATRDPTRFTTLASIPGLRPIIDARIKHGCQPLVRARNLEAVHSWTVKSFGRVWNASY